EEQLNLKGLSWKDIDFKTENHSIGGAGIILQKIAETKKEEKTATRVSPADFKEVKLAVDPAVKKLGIAAVSACISGITVRKKSEQVEALKEQYLSEIDFKENILSEYERLYDQLGVKQTSPIRLMIESLKEDRKFPNVNTVVDLYNAVSAKYNVSMGCHDLNKLQGTPKLIMTRGDEKFVPLGETKEEDVKQGIFSCVVDENVICYLDVKQGEKTKIGESTENIFIYAQGNKETSVEYLEKALSEACENIKLCCAGAKSHGFEILNLKIAEIKDVEEHPDADKLYVLKISIGSESKQLVAGLRQHYTKEELLGKKIIVVTNLKKAKLKGIDSQGMLLAGVEGENVGLLTAEKSNSGEQVFVEGENKFSIKEIEFSDFQKIKLEVKEGKPVFENKVLKTASEEITVEKVKNGTVM
ncbi:hypothetical protein JXA85_06360, partial [Candidatus Woesearchaeota archaeon]|nr:hypothetical protein [Candidatus Woesearchaeota archaeon]